MMNSFSSVVRDMRFLSMTAKSEETKAVINAMVQMAADCDALARKVGELSDEVDRLKRAARK